ncbi:MAG: Gmad2 immunoglobulin-like domain-containing protein [Coriobacteriia bacterium]|nr:Gmad2 immunoglobulin-like domain-containing protein [Coriobacteriia bacterium]
MKSLPWWFWVLGVVVIALAIGAGVVAGRTMSADDVGDETETTATVEPDEESEPETEAEGEVEAESTATQTVRVYLARGEYLGVVTREVPETPALARAAVEELLAGPTATEQGWGFGSEVPEGTRLLGLTIDGGTARVDLSGEYDTGGGTLSMTMRLAQVVYTLTQFSTVDRVVLMMDGDVVDVFGGEGIMLDEPQERGDYEYVLPAIFLESPTPGMTVGNPVRLTGTANTFEAAFMVRILGRDGSTIVEVPAMATSGTGTRGTFDVSVSYPLAAGGEGAIVVYEQSAKDGSDINVVEVPVTLGP